MVAQYAEHVALSDDLWLVGVAYLASYAPPAVMSDRRCAQASDRIGAILARVPPTSDDATNRLLLACRASDLPDLGSPTSSPDRKPSPLLACALSTSWPRGASCRPQRCCSA